MPVVPLNIKSRAIFKVINDGYENLNLDKKIRVMEELGNVKMDVKFLDGKTLGIGKNKLKIECSFSNNRPLSFTTRLEFSDDQ